MSWFFFFLFAVISLNSVVIYNLLKKAGMEDPSLFLVSGMALISACVFYKIAIGG